MQETILRGFIEQFLVANVREVGCEASMISLEDNSWIYWETHGAGGSCPASALHSMLPATARGRGGLQGSCRKEDPFPCPFNSWPLLCLLPAVPAGDRNDSILVAVSPVLLALRIEQLYFSAVAKSL